MEQRENVHYPSLCRDTKMISPCVGRLSVRRQTPLKNQFWFKPFLNNTSIRALRQCQRAELHFLDGSRCNEHSSQLLCRCHVITGYYADVILLQVSLQISRFYITYGFIGSFCDCFSLSCPCINIMVLMFWYHV